MRISKAVIIKTAEKRPKPIAAVTNDDYELANGFRARLKPFKRADQ